jgi:hypothetical protein
MERAGWGHTNPQGHDLVPSNTPSLRMPLSVQIFVMLTGVTEVNFSNALTVYANLRL